LFVEQLQDLHSAESQLIKALPAMAKAAHAPALKAGFEATPRYKPKNTPPGLNSSSRILGKEAVGKKCQAMEGLIKEGKEMISEKASPEVKDIGLIAAAQRVEHYEIAGYGCVRTYAKILGHREAAQTLQYHA
jgi:ferritin-like metal-binding protein YciE